MVAKARALDTPVAVRRAAMDLLARREHGRTELARKLLRRGADPALVDTELARLIEQGLLNEGRYLENYIASRARAGFGPLRIADELSARGLPAEAIDQALAQAGLDWAAILRDLWQRKFAKAPEDGRERARQGRFLSYRGFAMDQILGLLKHSG